MLEVWTAYLLVLTFRSLLISLQRIKDFITIKANKLHIVWREQADDEIDRDVAPCNVAPACAVKS